MFEAILDNAIIFRHLFEPLKELTLDIQFEVNEKGIMLINICNSIVAVDIFFSAHQFSKYKCDKSFIVGLSMGAFSKFLKSINVHHRLCIVCKENSSILSFILKDEHTKQVDFPLVDIAQDSFDIPEQEYSSNLTLSSKHFKEIIGEHDGEECTIKVTTKNVLLTSKDGDVRFKSTINQRDTSIIECKELFEAAYSLKYLTIFAKSFTVSEKVRLYFAKGLPLKVEYLFRDSHLLYYLPPRVEKEEEKDEQEKKRKRDE